MAPGEDVQRTASVVCRFTSPFLSPPPRVLDESGGPSVSVGYSFSAKGHSKSVKGDATKMLCKLGPWVWKGRELALGCQPFLLPHCIDNADSLSGRGGNRDGDPGVALRGSAFGPRTQPWSLSVQHVKRHGGGNHLPWALLMEKPPWSF